MRTILLGIAVCVVQGSCVAWRQRLPAAYLVTERGEGRLARVEVVALGTKVGAHRGLPHTVMQCLPGPGAAIQCLWGGLRGSPIYDDEGHLLGVYDQTYGVGSTRVFGMLEAAVLAVRWRRAAEARAAFALWPTVDRLSPERTEPGRSVDLLWAWGDVRAGIKGTISKRLDGARAMCLFEENPRRPTRRGLCSYALALAPVVAVASFGPSMESVREPGPVVGAVVFNDDCGSVAVLGWRPPAIEVTISVKSGDEAVQSCRAWIVSHAVAATDQLKDVIQSLLYGADADRSGTAVVNVVIDGGREYGSEVSSSESLVAPIAGEVVRRIVASGDEVRNDSNIAVRVSIEKRSDTPR